MYTPGIWNKRKNDDGTWAIRTNGGEPIATVNTEGDADLILCAQVMYDLIREVSEVRCMNDRHHEQASRIIQRVAGTDVAMLL